MPRHSMHDYVSDKRFNDGLEDVVASTLVQRRTRPPRW